MRAELSIEIPGRVPGRIRTEYKISESALHYGPKHVGWR
ncbi:hypothetical protein L838_3971 [Mycobacterium avium MAV_120709_2344]|nr:hypothetical protein L837_4207 [Mycobacterium avium MAV_061107_1842]ETZ45514.1 hypothetical protein L838_3971 [Mycobacterium avium MAV_120709_2344]